MGTTAQQTTLNALQLDAGMGWYQFLFLESFENNIVANPGGGQANAYQLTKQNNRITTVASSGDSVRLPQAVPGAEVIIIQHSAVNSCQVFGFGGTDTINDVSGSVGVSQMQNSAVLYLCFSPGAWYTEGLANGFSGGLQTFSVQSGIVAHAGGGQGAAVPLTAMNCFIATVATAGDSVVLPPAMPGMEITVINQSATATGPNVFPSSGQTINALAANTAIAVAPQTVLIFWCGIAGSWWTK
jgi:hypothetical protein